MSTEDIDTLPLHDRLCTLVARRIEEDPIGSANPCRRCLVLELPLPWKPEVTHSDAFPDDLRPVLKQARREGELPVLGVVPEPAYSVPGRTRVMMFRFLSAPFSGYEREEYLVPPDRLVALTSALILRTPDLDAFDAYRQDLPDARDLMVCTHGTHDQCCGKYGYPLYAALRDVCDGSDVRVWRTSHFTGHRFSPTLMDYPGGRSWGNLDNPEDIRRLADPNGALPDLDRCYRGWSGAGFLAQSAERECFRQVGWDWTNRRLDCRVTDVWTDAGHHVPDKPVWARIDGDLIKKARVQIDSIDVNGSAQTHVATVEFSHMVQTLYDCIKRGNLGESPQFRVTDLT